MPNKLAHPALRPGRLARLGATRDLHHGPLSRFAFRPLPSQHERIESRSHVDAAVEDFGHLGRDRQLDAVPGGKRQARSGRAHAF